MPDTTRTPSEKADGHQPQLPTMPPAAATPVLRWAGGKRRLLDLLHATLPKGFNSSDQQYFEPFVGGGALFFALPVAGHRCHLNDINSHVINIYRQLRDNLGSFLDVLHNEYADRTTEDAYYHVRDNIDPNTLNDLQQAAWALYLNRTCFNGLWRENKSGKFNVPYGHLKNPQIVHEPRLRAAATKLAGATLTNTDFTTAVQPAEAGDLVYFDPPYVPLTPTASFTSYSADGFGKTQHQQLADTISQLTERGVHVMLSNSDTPTTRSLYGTDGAGLDLIPISAPRSIAASGNSRQPVGEVLGINYPRSSTTHPPTVTIADTSTHPNSDP